jgi:hypothetical protein
VSSLSVLCITNDPGDQVAAILAPLRPVADEIVIAADTRVTDEQLAIYAAACDRLVLYAFAPPFERAAAWVHGQCRGDWILRIDGDELLPPRLIARLPDLIARRDRVQYWLPRRWSFPDADHWLDERPWHPDHQLRLVRNDPATLSFPGVLHSSALPRKPFELVDDPMYHLNLLLHSRTEREVKSADYDSMRPGLVAPGGGPQNLYYEPERWAEHAPSVTHPNDAQHIRAVLSPRPAPTATVERSALMMGGRTVVDACWDARALLPEDYVATIRPLEAHLRLAPGAEDMLAIRITNRGTTTWPGGLVRQPAIRLGHRWLAPDGSVLVTNTHRSGLPCALGPDESVIAWLSVLVPARRGHYLIEIDLVHENVRWFNSCVRLPVRVHERSSRVEPTVKTEQPHVGDAPA